MRWGCFCNQGDETDQWLIFPHEIDGLTVEEIRRHKPEAAIILRDEDMPNG